MQGKTSQGKAQQTEANRANEIRASQNKLEEKTKHIKAKQGQVNQSSMHNTAKQIKASQCKTKRSKANKLSSSPSCTRNVTIFKDVTHATVHVVATTTAAAAAGVATGAPAGLATAAFNQNCFHVAVPLARSDGQAHFRVLWIARNPTCIHEQRSPQMLAEPCYFFFGWGGSHPGS